jgi:hypothetical protein
MIEDRDCKKEFTELVMKARRIKLGRPIQLIDFGLDEDNIYYILYKPKLKPVKSEGSFLGRPDVKPVVPEIAYQIAVHAEGAENFIDGHPIPEEVYCKALELYKSNQKHEASVGNYNIRVGKRTGAGLPRKYTIEKECMIYKTGSGGLFKNPVHGFKITFREEKDASYNSLYPEIVDDFNKMVDSI